MKNIFNKIIIYNRGRLSISMIFFKMENARVFNIAEDYSY